MPAVNTSTHHIGSYTPSNATAVSCQWTVYYQGTGTVASSGDYHYINGTGANAATIDIMWDTVNNYTLDYSCNQNTGACFASPFTSITVNVTNPCANCTLPFALVTTGSVFSDNNYLAPTMTQMVNTYSIGTQYNTGPAGVYSNGNPFTLDMDCGTLAIIGTAVGYTVDYFNPVTGLTSITPTTPGIHTICWEYTCTLTGASISVCGRFNSV